MPDVNTLYQELIAELKQVSLLGSCAGVLGWDEQTYLPPGGVEHRANQLSLLAGMVHERATSPRIGELLSSLEQSGKVADDNDDLSANVREARRSYDRAVKLPRRLVEELSRVTSLGQQAWIEARKKSSFNDFLPWLEQIVTLKREQAIILATGDGPAYDALLDEFETGATTASVKAVFDPLRKELVELAAAIRESGRKPRTDVLKRSYPVDLQKKFAIEAAKKIGFSFHDGRLDVAAHPFCSGMGPGDCRLTTRYDEHDFPQAFFGVMHEVGHGIYEQGLDRSAYGTPLGETVSLGIHESQSRMWENFVGRSLPFWEHFYAPLQQTFPQALGDVSLDEFYAAINTVGSSFIRVESDEVTYNLHIMLRFEMEQQLISGSLKCSDVPNAWNSQFEHDFGLKVPNDTLGCLQDIHWSGGLIGYFPTYALGNMYAAQFFAHAQKELGDLAAQFRQCEFGPLKNWLNEKIHKPGKRYTPQELLFHVTGERLSPTPLILHLTKKFSSLYGM
ncbi:MAG: carboxypeptidase M32 [Planctomycetaceae bacterium]